VNALPDSPLVLDAVVFDLDDTLHDDALSLTNAARHVAQVCFEDPEVGARAAKAYVRVLEQFWVGLQGSAVTKSVTGMRARVWTEALEDFPGLPADHGERCAAVYDSYRREHFVLWDGVRELLTDLRARGSRLGLLTNGFTETHQEKIELLGLRSFFDTIIISDEVGMIKPDPRVFRLACERLGVAPEQATMVGDRFDKDVSGAQGIGMKTLWVNVRGELPHNEHVVPDVTVGSFSDADAALRRAMRASSRREILDDKI
jgi:putative hydrolase of the HAD superfamily